MGYLGNSNVVQNFTPAVDYFNGNGSATAFTLSRTVGSAFDIQAFIENVPQNPSSAFTVAGNVITFTSAPPSGTNNIYVRYTSPVTQLVKPAPGTVGSTEIASGTITPTAVSDQLNSSTGYFDLPAGTTAQRPSSPVAGMIRHNTTTGYPEWYDTIGAAWVPFSEGAVYSVEYLVIAGGGGGGGSLTGSYAGGGGGGAGGYRTASGFNVNSATGYTVTIGAGGAGSSKSADNGISGSDSVFASITSTGGGGGGTSNNRAEGVCNGVSGGSGGGSAGRSGTGGSATSGQGFAGGNVSSNVGGGAGGGGASAAGGSLGSSQTGAAGGAGISSSITGSAVTRAGGGGGGSYIGSGGGTGGAGGGGNGGIASNTGSAGTANTGGGGGGGGQDATGGAGGSGIVIIRYLGTQRATGGTVTSSGGYTIHTFTSSGTFTA